jgi:hypothetical protein
MRVSTVQNISGAKRPPWTKHHTGLSASGFDFGNGSYFLDGISQSFCNEFSFALVMVAIFSWFF